jgi:hypothetical protein
MKKIKTGTFGNWAGSAVLGLKACACGIALAAAASATLPAQAGPATPLTQIEYIRLMVQVNGAASQFSAGSTVADYVQWARDNGMNPARGWQPGAALSSDVLAATLGQFLQLNSTKGGADMIRELEINGIYTPKGAIVTRADFAGIVDSFGMQTATGRRTLSPKSSPAPLGAPKFAPTSSLPTSDTSKGGRVGAK